MATGLTLVLTLTLTLTLKTLVDAKRTPVQPSLPESTYTVGELRLAI